MPEASEKDRRLAALAAALARAATAGEIHEADALRVLRHQLRIRNTNRALRSRVRSRAAADVIARHATAGTRPPQNGSPDALHSDHVFPLTRDRLSLHTVDEWLEALAEITTVVCVTAAENYRLELIERSGVHGWEKYEAAGIELVRLDDVSG